MIVRLAPRVRVPVQVAELRCARNHGIDIRARLHQRECFVRCDFTYGSGHRCDAWCHIQPVGLAWLNVTDVTAEQVVRLRDSVFLPEYIASQVVLEYRRTLRRRAG